MKLRLATLLPCAALTPLAGGLGALADERGHSGLSSWVSLCRGGAAPYARSLWFQFQLMPYALCAMLAVALLTTLALWSRRGGPTAARVILAGHLGCLSAVLLAPLLCPPLLGLNPTPGRALGGMTLAETTITLLVAAVVVLSLDGQGSQRAAHAACR
jgi:hypothetical protein